VGIVSDVSLNAECLLSKWGFSDGDVLWDWACDHGVELGDAGLAEHRALQSLVRKFLVPAIEAAGHAVEVVDLETIHNPIYADRLDGEEVPWPKGRPSQFAALEGISVTIPAGVVRAELDA